jgi:RHS repeat-associated protein
VGAPTVEDPPPASEIVEYYHLDAVGSVRVTTNASGQVVRRHEFLPFGEEWQPAVPPGDPRLFTGQERDPETGLDYFGARYYRANLGRFTTTDPVQDLRENLADPQQWNRYTYASNNPLRYVDPDGRDLADIVGLVVSARNWVLQRTSPPDGSGHLRYQNGVPAPKGELAELVSCIADTVGTTLTITSTNEVTPVHAANSPHGRGEAADIRIGAKTEAAKLNEAAAECKAGATQDEVSHPSPRSTKAHFHVQTHPEPGGWTGDLPPVPKPQPATGITEDRKRTK